MLLIFSGCTAIIDTIAIESGKEQIKEVGADDKATYFCYDLYNKKDCPRGTYQYDRDLVFLIPGTSRFCFGITPVTPNQYGMHCWYHNFIKKGE